MTIENFFTGCRDVDFFLDKDCFLNVNFFTFQEVLNRNSNFKGRCQRQAQRNRGG